MRTSNQAEKGFTLIELIIVILVLGVIAALALPAYSSMIRRARYAEVKKQMGIVAKEVQMYRVEFGQYPPDVNPRQQPEGVINWPQEVPFDGYYDYDHWGVGPDQCYVQIGFVGEELSRDYKLFESNARPTEFKEFNDDLVLGVDTYECLGGRKGAIR